MAAHPVSILFSVSASSWESPRCSRPESVAECYAYHPVAAQCHGTNDCRGTTPAKRHELAAPKGEDTPQNQPGRHQWPESMKRHAALKVTMKGGCRGSREVTTRAGNTSCCQKRATPPRPLGMDPFEPDVAGERRRQQKARMLQPPQKTVQGSAVHRTHDYVDGSKDGHDVGHLVSLEDVGKDLQVVAVGSADFEAPGGDVVVALDENADFALA